MEMPDNDDNFDEPNLRSRIARLPLLDDDEVLSLSLALSLVDSPERWLSLNQVVATSLDEDKNEKIEQTPEVSTTLLSSCCEGPPSKDTDNLKGEQAPRDPPTATLNVDLESVKNLLVSLLSMDTRPLERMAVGLGDTFDKREMAKIVQSHRGSISTLKDMLAQTQERMQKREEGKELRAQHKKESDRAKNVARLCKIIGCHKTDDVAKTPAPNLTKLLMDASDDHDRIQRDTSDVLQAALDVFEGFGRMEKAARAGSMPEFEKYDREFGELGNRFKYARAILQTDLRKIGRLPPS